MNNSINSYRLHIIRKNKDCTFRWYKLHLLISFYFSKIFSYSCIAFFPETPCMPNCHYVRTYVMK